MSSIALPRRCVLEIRFFTFSPFRLYQDGMYSYQIEKLHNYDRVLITSLSTCNPQEQPDAVKATSWRVARTLPREQRQRDMQALQDICILRVAVVFTPRCNSSKDASTSAARNEKSEVEYWHMKSLEKLIP
ncbi:hypothetical protein M404DRAFT_31606 [Pisolithus tinctorius Marx 270]|uniref:Uncharacterized protein n=1 Tax=Pisolithus tinctorius Marx 270 TaxID=870435 RepID=A0A0C3NAB2_PISTI|nr:hypothetical protein M404DRAFT_31606 [Pisolithus tinctorius Marx 270]